MKDIQHYKDLIAVENGYKDWAQVRFKYYSSIIDAQKFDNLENEWAKRYGADLCKEKKKLCADALDIGYEDDLHKQQILNARLATDN